MANIMEVNQPMKIIHYCETWYCWYHWSPRQLPPLPLAIQICRSLHDAAIFCIAMEMERGKEIKKKEWFPNNNSQHPHTTTLITLQDYYSGLDYVDQDFNMHIPFVRKMVNELWSGNNVTMLNDMLNMTGFIVLSVQTLELQYSMKQLLKDRIYPVPCWHQWWG